MAAAPSASTFVYSSSFVELLENLKTCLLVSNYYDGGQILTIGAREGKLLSESHRFDKSLGIAVREDRIAIACNREILLLVSAPELAKQIPPEGLFDACFMARKSHITAEIQAHEMGWSDRELWIVNTAFSCLCTLDERHSFVPRWTPPFSSALGPEDRCHLNGLAMENFQPRYVTAIAETDTPQGWRERKSSGGCIMDVMNNEIIARGFAMPHSPRIVDGRLWALDSGRGLLTTVDRATGRIEPVVKLPGYTRGFAVVGPYAFIGLSTMRKSSNLHGVPIHESGEPLLCGLRAVDLRTGSVVGQLDFTSGVEEMFGVEAIPNVSFAAIIPPDPQANGKDNIWFLPPML